MAFWFLCGAGLLAIGIVAAIASSGMKWSKLLTPKDQFSQEKASQKTIHLLEKILRAIEKLEDQMVEQRIEQAKLIGRMNGGRK